MAENLVYRGHPLRRVDNLVYYGSMADKYIIMMQVLDTEDVKDLKLAKRVSIQLQLTDPNLRSRDRVVRSTEKDAEIHQILSTVYRALEEKGYNPINQIVGYILSEDPTYITNHRQARTLIRKLDRDELLQVLLRSYLSQ